MILRRLTLRDFRRFHHFEVAFAPGFNVVVGDNEAGKSTLREAITLALFQDPKTTDRKVLHQRRWGAQRQFALELDFEVDGQGYHLAKDFQAKTARLQDGVSGEILQDARAIDERVKALLGLDSRSLFDSTVRITQRDITRIQGGQEIADSLQRLLSGGEQDIHASDVLGELDKALAALKTAARDNPGPLSTLPPQIGEKERLRAEKSASLDRAETARQQLVVKEKALAEARRRLTLEEQRQKDCAERLQLADALVRAKAAEDELDARVGQIRELERGIAQAERDLSQYEVVLSLPREQVDEIAVLERQAATLPPHPPGSGAARPGHGLPYVWIAGMLLIIVGFFTDRAVSFIGLAVLAYAAWQSRSRDTGSASLAALRAAEQQVAAEAAAERLAGILAATGCGAAADFRYRRGAAEDLQRGVAERRARFEGLLAGGTVDAVEAKRKAASRMARDLSERLEEPRLKLATIDQVEFQRLVADIAAHAKDIEALQGEVMNLRVAVAAGSVNLEDVHALEEELQALRARLAAAQERQQVLTLTRRVLEEARAATMVSAKDLLAAELGHLMLTITSARYSCVEVDERLAIRLLSPEADAMVDVALDGDLSTGAVEQVYLAARLAIARLLAQGRRPPLILDDPFVTYDATRTAAVLALCQRLSADNQVILFTCQQDCRHYADNVIALPAVGTPVQVT